jgi:phenylpyruvate tautomerase PptA (4-oxalocrotonate tautomerase family)
MSIFVPYGAIFISIDRRQVMPTVIVYWSPGRTDEQKQRVSRRIAEALVEEGSARVEDVLIIFQNIEPGDSARGPDLLKASIPPLDAQPPNDDDWERTHGP